MEANLRSKLLYKSVLYLIKVIPMLTSGVIVLNTVLSFCFEIDAPILSYIGGMSILSILFFYLASYLFKFCAWHRMFIHYTTINWIINIIDYHTNILLTDREMFAVYVMIAGACLFIGLYLKAKDRNNLT